ncbi:Hypothetical predicted protein [Octopus vulgaris]|uniref:Uncharacterized protein n=1 Tax=Octopus vulgaris TaxID=6645 RepID=A0AA36BG08_OCTVU|nr:Hypothetical predicted protein [Octopus vulgaris]
MSLRCLLLIFQNILTQLDSALPRYVLMLHLSQSFYEYPIELYDTDAIEAAKPEEKPRSQKRSREARREAAKQEEKPRSQKRSREARREAAKPEEKPRSQKRSREARREAAKPEEKPRFCQLTAALQQAFWDVYFYNSSSSMCPYYFNAGSPTEPTITDKLARYEDLDVYIHDNSSIVLAICLRCLNCDSSTELHDRMP